MYSTSIPELLPLGIDEITESHAAAKGKIKKSHFKMGKDMTYLHEVYMTPLRRRICYR